MLITLEGTEGSGKSTQAENLFSYLSERGWPCVFTREPGGTLLGDRLRDLLLNLTAVPLNSRAEALLFAAARAQLVTEVIEPHLATGRIVVCDRFSDSTLAYQGFGRGLDPEKVRQMVEFATGGLLPDLTILLDVPPEIGLARKGSGQQDRFEREAPDFHRRVREGYLTLARWAPARWLVVDGRLAPEEVAAIVRAKVDELLSERGRPAGAAERH